MKFRIFLTLAFIPCATLGACGQSMTAADSVKERIKAVENNLTGPVRIEGEPSWTIKERMEHYGVKGLSIAVIRHYRIDWAKGYGWADDSAKTPVTTGTLFQAASISKSLNAVGVLKLAQDHKVDLYTDINAYLTSWKFPYDSLAKNKKITIAELLSHTAGLTVHGFPGYQRGSSLPTVPQILDGKAPANSPAVRSMAEPGLNSVYSGGGITISQQIVMDVTHQAYAQYMAGQVLGPLGMTSSSYEQPNTSADPSLLATGYDAGGKEIPGKYHIYPEQAAAGLWTNPTDLAKYIIETQLALEGKFSKVLNQSFTQLRLTPYLDKAAALGVFITDLNGIKYFQHGGANEGFRSQYFGSLEDGNGIVVMVNSDNGAIMSEVINSVVSVYGLKGFTNTVVRKRINIADTVLLQSYTGHYRLRPDFVLTVTREGKNLFTQATGQPVFQLYAEAAGKFFLTVVDAEVEFEKDETGKIGKVVLYQNGQAHEAKRIEP
jgi:CubicO group peptidase (beta-lactamase class C family)